MECNTCGHYELYKMLTSGQSYSYSGDIPCIRCKHYLEPQSQHTLEVEAQDGED